MFEVQDPERARKGWIWMDVCMCGWLCQSRLGAGKGFMTKYRRKNMRPTVGRMASLTTRRDTRYTTTREMTRNCGSKTDGGDGRQTKGRRGVRGSPTDATREVFPAEDEARTHLLLNRARRPSPRRWYVTLGSLRLRGARTASSDMRCARGE